MPAARLPPGVAQAAARRTWGDKTGFGAYSLSLERSRSKKGVSVPLSMDQRLSGPLLKLNRAKFHIECLKAAIAAFIATQPHAFVMEENAELGQVTYKVVKVDPLPPIISAIVGDALYNLRAALDHLAQQFYLVGSGSSAQSSEVAFPIFKDISSYRDNFRRKVKGMREDAIAFIESTKPYRGDGGTEALWKLHALNNIDKHRVVLAVQAAAGPVGLDVTQWIMDLNATGQKGQFSMNFIMPQTKCPVEVGDELFTEVGPRNPSYQVRPIFFMTLHEPSVIKPQPITRALEEFAATVERILNDARPLLA